MHLHPPANPAVFPDRQQVTAALERAAKRARTIAEQTGTRLIVVSTCPSQVLAVPPEASKKAPKA